MIDLSAVPTHELRAEIRRRNLSERDALVLERLDDGIFHREIAREFGISQNTVSRIAAMHGRSRGSGLPAGYTFDRTKELLAQVLPISGTPQALIATRLGITKQYVSALAIRSGRRRRAGRKAAISGRPGSARDGTAFDGRRREIALGDNDVVF